MTTLQSLSLNQTITKIDELIDSGNGDVGRLYHILEFLKNKKMLYKTDRTYLETKLNSSFEVEEKIIEDVKTEDEKELLPQIKKLIKNKDGDVGRLQHISDMIIQHRELFRTDLDYLKSKISPDDKVITPPKISDTKQSSQTSSKQNNLKTELTPKPKIRGSMPKGWSPKTNEIELNDISKNIEDEKEKILQQQKISNELNSKKLKLIELMDHRKKYEQKISNEKYSLENLIKDERLKIKIQTKLSQDILLQKEEIVKIKNERTNILKKIDSKKSKLSNELLDQKNELIQIQLEQEKIEKQIKNEQDLLSEMSEEQKIRLSHQVTIAQEIKSKQEELEKSNKNLNEIASQIKEEKAKFSESKKLNLQIKSQERELINAKKDRLKLINALSKEKMIISKKTLEEHKKLKSQNELTKQLKIDEKMYNLLKKKREKLESEIKSKNKKLKERQRKLKKQIDGKEKKLRIASKSNKIKI